MRPARKKANFKKRFLVLLLICSIWIGETPVITHATGKTQSQINKAENELNNLEGKQEETEENLEELEAQGKNLAQQLAEYNDQLADITAKIEHLQAQILQKEADIVLTRSNLEAAKEKERVQYENMTSRIQYDYENGQLNLLSILFSGVSIAQMLNMLDYMDEIAQYDRKLKEEYFANRVLIEEEEARLLEELEDLNDLTVQAQAEQARMDDIIRKMNETIEQNERAISQTEKAIQEYEDSIKELEKDLKKLYKKLEEEKAASLAAAQGAWRDISDITFEEGDRKLLANLIYCEAGGEPYIGQVAVGAVVINRMRSARYPSTMTGVIYQRSQFSPVGSGRLQLYLSIDKANASCYRAADEAMSGYTNVGNCVYFRTPIPGLTGIAIGGHIFY
ncbi:MAG: cell wall hydrolase [Clostridium sp.]|jgi:spore germination cell wall hydrolase CwlJ-like protein|nr:cell wall hydrolase [Clostridium sp.]